MDGDELAGAEQFIQLETWLTARTASAELNGDMRVKSRNLHAHADSRVGHRMAHRLPVQSRPQPGAPISVPAKAFCPFPGAGQGPRPPAAPTQWMPPPHPGRPAASPPPPAPPANAWRWRPGVEHHDALVGQRSRGMLLTPALALASGAQAAGRGISSRSAERTSQQSESRGRFPGWKFSLNCKPLGRCHSDRLRYAVFNLSLPSILRM